MSCSSINVNRDRCQPSRWDTQNDGTIEKAPKM